MNSAEALEKHPVLKSEKASDGTPYRVVRGAAWRDDEEIRLRSACRRSGRPAARNDFDGFRCVVVVSGG